MGEVSTKDFNLLIETVRNVIKGDAKSALTITEVAKYGNMDIGTLTWAQKN